MLRSFGYVFVLFMISVQTMAAQPKVPESLQEWRDWVLHDQPSFTCPYQFNTPSKACEWSSGLQLRVDDSGGEFRYSVTTFAEDWVTLPGGSEHWPRFVTNNDKSIAVTDAQGTPRVFLNKN